MLRQFPLTILVTVCLVQATATAETPSTAQVMATAADAFINALDATQEEQATFSFDADERLNWHYIPRERKGVSLKGLDPFQRRAAMALLRSGLSKVGYRKITLIRELESVLHRLEGTKRKFPRDPELYFFSIFGTPGTTETWGWRYEGHHCSLNFTIIKGRRVASEPLFLGANPARVPSGEMSGLRTLDAEEDKAWSLVRSLNDEQKTKAILSNQAPPEILTKAERKAATLDDQGIAYGELNEGQQKTLRSLIDVYARTVPAPLADARLAAVREAGLDKIKFAWMGGTERGQGHYYRIQGGTFLIELDNTQNNANHVHAVWRDFNGDFGRDVLAMHYRLYPHGVADARSNGVPRTVPKEQVTGNTALMARVALLSGKVGQ